jgi:hypothetical protein
LKYGLRGLKPGPSLAKLLFEHRSKRHQHFLPKLTPDLILTWADAHHNRTGNWPTPICGAVHGVSGETWCAVNSALRGGGRGLPGGSSLIKLLAAERGVRDHLALPPFDPELILGWADAYHARTGKWPKADDGPIPEAPGETWMAVEAALIYGYRGLPGGDSLPRLLQARRGVRNRMATPRLEQWEILLWADAHFARTGRWPSAMSGPISEAPGETWRAVDEALRKGIRGLPGGDTLAQLLSRRRGTRNICDLPALTRRQIAAWAKAHHARTGHWPGQRSGAIADAPGETWSGVDTALRHGSRGLPGGSSLARLLSAEFGARNRSTPPPLTLEQILAWADAHHGRTGAWPMVKSGPIAEAPDENWMAVDKTLQTGARGLPGGDSLARLLERERGKPGARRR